MEFLHNLDRREEHTMAKNKDKKLNIAMLGHKRIPSREGGIEIVVGELATRMVEQGYNVTCYNRSGHHIAGAKFDNKKACDKATGDKMILASKDITIVDTLA